MNIFTKVLTAMFFKPEPTEEPHPVAKPGPPHVIEDRYGRRYLTVEGLEAMRKAHQESLARVDY